MFYVKVSAHIQKVSTEFLPKRTAILVNVIYRLLTKYIWFESHLDSVKEIPLICANYSETEFSNVAMSKSELHSAPKPPRVFLAPMKIFAFEGLKGMWYHVLAQLRHQFRKKEHVAELLNKRTMS
jgi:hypothetical protein